MTGNPNPPAPAPASGDVNQAFNNLLQRHNSDALQLSMQLYQENFTLREERRQLKDQLTEAGKKIPAVGTRILTEDEAKLFDAYKALGKPEELAGQKTELHKVKRTQQISLAAQAAGYKASVLERLVGEIEIEISKETADGKEIEVPYVTVDQKKVKLVDHAKTAWAEFLPALEVTETGSQTQQTTFVRQPAPGKGPEKKDLVSEIIAAGSKRSDQSNPLLARKENAT